MKVKKILLLIILIIATVFLMLLISEKNSFAAELTPTSDQYLELKLSQTEEITDGTKATFELWAYGLKFKGFDIRLEYDENVVSLLKANSNEESTGLDYFKFDSELGTALDLIKAEGEVLEPNTLRFAVSLNPIMDEEGNVSYGETSATIGSDENGDYMDSTDGVLIGRINFLVKDISKFKETVFALKDSTTHSPLTGIKIARTDSDYYSNVSLFKVTMQEPTGTVSGNITTSNSNNIYKATIKAYTANEIDWENMTSHIELDEKTPIASVISNDDGTYQLQLPEGTYDILIDKDGYLDHIYTNVSITKNNDYQLGTKALIGGDSNKDGFIKVEDLDAFNTNYGLDTSSESYNIKYDYTEDGYIKVEDLDRFNTNYGSIREIVNKEGN